MLARWWRKKYKLPSNHDLFQQEPLIYWLIEYFEDYFEENHLEVHRNENGDIQFTDTGDELIDKWEQMLADGEVPDLTEAFSPEALKELQRKFSSRSNRAGTSTTFGSVAKMAMEETMKVRKDLQIPQPSKKPRAIFGTGED